MTNLPTVEINKCEREREREREQEKGIDLEAH
jgi:hypothetical protein